MNETQNQKMVQLEAEAKRGVRRWVIIMIAIMVAVIAIAVVVSVIGGLQYAPYALIFAIIAVAITAKLCVDQMGKVKEKLRNEREKLDAGSGFSGFHLHS